LDTDRCSKRFSVKDKNVAGWKRQLFVFVIIMLFISASLFSVETENVQATNEEHYDVTDTDSIPWSTEVKRVAFLRNPSNLYLNLQNIKAIDSVVDSEAYQSHLDDFFRGVSLAYNVTPGIVERFFHSDIVLFWDGESGYNDQYMVKNLFSLESLIPVIRDSLENGAICVRNFDGLTTFLKEFSLNANENEEAEVFLREINGYMLFSENREVFEALSNKISSRSAFSEDILYYNVESGRTTEIINAYSFLNIERKRISDQRVFSYLDSKKLQESHVSDYFGLSDFHSLQLASIGKLKSVFYNQFVVAGSSEEWERLFNQLSACSTAFAFLRTDEEHGFWRLVFVLEDFEEFKTFWQKKSEEWNLNEETENDNMLMALDDRVFIISNYKDKRESKTEETATLFKRLLEIADQSGVVETTYQKMNELTLFSFIKIDDTIEKEVLRIYGDL